MKTRVTYKLPHKLNGYFVSLLKRLQLVLLLAVFANIALIYKDNGNSVTTAGTLILSILILLSYWALHKSRIVLGILVLNWGLWLFAAVYAFLIIGIRTPVVIFLPIVIMATAWLQGRRIAWLMALATALVYIVVTLAETQGWMVWTIHRSPMNYLVVYVAVSFYAAGLAITLDESFQSIYAVEKMLAQQLHDRVEELTQAQARLHELNDTLENRVHQRTSELEQTNANLITTIEELDKTRASLVQSEKLSALGFMVAGISHELNTPIGNANLAFTSLVYQLQQLEQQYRSGQLARSSIETFFADYHNTTDLVSRSIERTITLIAKFREVARDQTSEQRQHFNLHALVVDSVNLIQLPNKQAPWIILIDINDALQLDSYPGPLGQILNNLLANSISHGFEGRQNGQITISTAEIPGQQEIVLSVSDDGIGIKPEHLGNIFDPFFTTKLGQGGSGIGLHISHRIVTSVLGGSISVVSTVNGGSVFSLRLPLIAPEQLKSATLTG